MDFNQVESRKTFERLFKKLKRKEEIALQKIATKSLDFF